MVDRKVGRVVARTTAAASSRLMFTSKGRGGDDIGLPFFKPTIRVEQMDSSCTICMPFTSESTQLSLCVVSL